MTPLSLTWLTLKPPAYAQEYGINNQHSGQGASTKAILLYCYSGPIKFGTYI